MKSKFYKKAALAFIIGLLLCGAGAGVCVAEYSQLKIVKQTEEATEDEFEYDLPKGESLYLKGYGRIKLSVDEKVPSGKLILKVKHGIDSTVEKNDISSETIVQYDRENEKENKWQVKTLEMPDVELTDAGGSFDLSEFSDHFKKKEIYYKCNFETEYTVLVNPADKENVIRMWLHDDLMTEDEYSEEREEGKSGKRFYSESGEEIEYDDYEDYEEEMEEFKDEMREMKDELKEEIEEEIKEGLDESTKKPIKAEVR